jgi:uncharacterized protein YcfJ
VIEKTKIASRFVCQFSSNLRIKNMSTSFFTKALATQTLAASLLASLGLCFSAQAQEVGNVISRTPVYQQVAIPRQVCTQTQVSVPGQNSGAGALMGAIAGGAIGNSVGKGDGRALATMIGVIGGAMAGDKIESPAAAQTQTQQTCTTQQVYENRLMGYNVVYEFGGKQYTVQLPKDPGPTIKLQITPMSAAPLETAGPEATVMAETNSTVPPQIYTAATQTVVVQSPYYRYNTYTPYPVFTHVNLNFDMGVAPRYRNWR